VVETVLTLHSSAGLHARPAALFYRKARMFQARLTIQNLSKPDSRELAVTPVNLLLADVDAGHTIRLRADGPDEQAALLALQQLIEADFGE
jgi:phosphotransferase system HPr (HPr) family protein